MRVGIIQSSFIPWRGYFDFINSVDIFVFYDDIQYTKGDWRNRNRIKTEQGSKWLTVPVCYERLSKLICDTVIDDTQDWRKIHMQQWLASYANAPYFDDVINLLGAMGRHEDLTISQLNIRLIKVICDYLDIDTPLLLSSELNVQGVKTPRLINLLQALGATTYLSGPSADNYLEKQLFYQAGIRLEYKSYDYEPYPQLWGAFDNALTILDLIANCGADAKNRIASRSANSIVVA
ncbi:WbqC family protein [Sulfuriferula nivalis]|uniref:WbqC family protein n=1 Tax=Sulfuriferula nivalis TaxID=2675298 RepID=UPI00138A05DE|nr:WbqC family protein [Sulfuriferula nivalis]